MHAEYRPEERGQFVVGIQRKNMSDVLIRTDHHECAPFAIDGALAEDISRCVVRKCLLVVDETVASLARKQKRRQVFDTHIAMRLLQHRAEIEHAVDVGILWRDAPQDGIGRGGEMFAERIERGAFRIRERVQTPATIGAGRVSEMSGLCIRDTNHRR